MDIKVIKIQNKKARKKQNKKRKLIIIQRDIKAEKN